MGSKLWGEGKAEPEEKAPEAVAPAPAKASGHVHEWTQVSATKRKCKPCGAVERSDA